MNIQTKTSGRRGGFTLVEMMVATGLGTVVVGAVIAAFIAGSRSFAATGNYIDLNRTSLGALDQMTRDIRQARSLQSFATNQMVFIDSDSNQLTYAWAPATQQLTRSVAGATKVLLKNCDYLLFDISQRNPNTDGTFGFFPATNNPAICKLVSVSWRCSRTVLGQVNSENVQTAKIVMRN